MEENKKIVEFVGLPACGKSFLCEALKEDLQKDDQIVWTWKDLTTSFKKSSIIKKVLSFNVIDVLLVLKNLAYLPKSKERKWFVYWFSVKVVWLYSYAVKFGNFEFLMIEHGIVQQTISNLYGQNIVTGDKFSHTLISFLNRTSIRPYLIYFQNSDIDVCMERMQKRNRTNEGRLDKEADIIKRRLMFENEKKNLEMIINIICDNCYSWSMLKINMLTELPEQKEQVKSFLI